MALCTYGLWFLNPGSAPVFDSAPPPFPPPPDPTRTLRSPDLVVGVERIDSRRFISENGSIETDPAGTDVWFYVIDPRSDVILARRSGRLDR